MIRVWRYWMVRPKSFLLMSQAMLLTLIVSHAALNGQPHTVPIAIRENLGLLLIVLAPQICSYWNGLDTLIVSPDYKTFARRAAASLGMGLGFSIPLFLLFPDLFPGYTWAAAAVCLSGLSFFGLRSLLRCLVKRKKVGEGMLILGTGELAKKFYNDREHEKVRDGLQFGAAGAARPGK